MKLFIFLISSVFSLTALAQTPSNDSNDFSDVDVFLKQTETARKEKNKETLTSLKSKLNSSLESDNALIAAYKDAYINVNFDGLKREYDKIRSWENANKAKFKDQNFITGLRLHVQYLVATLTKKEGNDETAVKQVLQWIQYFPVAPDVLDNLSKNDFLTKGIENSVFLKASNQAGILQGMQDWYVGDLNNIPEIHRIDVIQFFRMKKDPQIFTQWQMNLKMEQDAAEKESLESKRLAFVLHRRPWLLWQVAKDYDVLGQKRQAVDALMAILKENPNCEDYDKILTDLKKLIAKQKPSDSKTSESKPAEAMSSGK